MESGFWEIIARFLSISDIKTLPLNTALLHPFQHIYKLQIETSKW